MNAAEKKSMCDELVKVLNAVDYTSGITLEETDTEYVITGQFYKDIDINLNVRKQGDIAIFKVLATVLTGQEYDLEVLGGDVVKRAGDEANLHYTTYDDKDGKVKMTLQSLVPHGGIGIQDTTDKIKIAATSTLKAIAGLIENFEHKTEGSSEKTKDETPILEPKEEEEKNMIKQMDEDDFDMVGDVMRAFEDPAKEEETSKGHSTEKKVVDAPLEKNKEGKKREKHARYRDKKIQTEAPKAAPAETILPEEKGSKKEDIKELESRVDLSKTVSDQIRQVYSDVDSLFEKKRAEVKKREALLNDYASSLNAKEAELDKKKESYDQELAIAKNQLESEYRKKSVDLEIEFEKKAKEKDAEVEKIKRDLSAKESDIEKRLDAVKTEETRIEFEWKKVNDEKETVDMLLRDAKEKESLISKLPEGSGNNEALKEELETVKKELEIVISENDKVCDEIDEANEKLDQLEEENNALKNRVKNMQSEGDRQKNSLNKEIKELNEKIAELEAAPATSNDFTNERSAYEAKIAELESENNSIKEALKQAENTPLLNQDNEAEIVRLKGMYEAEKAEKEKLLAASTGGALPVDLNTMAKAAMADLAALGIQTEIVPGNGSMILHWQNAEYSLVVSIKDGMTYIERKVKKPSRYLKQFEQWSQEDIRTSFIVGENKVICKSKYDRLAVETRGLMEKLSQL